MEKFNPRVAVERALANFMAQDAVFHAENWVSLSPRSEEAAYFLGLAYQRNGQLLAAYETLKNSLNFRSQFLFASCAYALKRYQDALNTVEGLMAKHSADSSIDLAGLHTLAGQVYRQMGRASESTSHFKHALKLDPGCYTAIEGIASQGSAVKIDELFASQHSGQTSEDSKDKKRTRSGQSKDAETGAGKSGETELSPYASLLKLCWKILQTSYAFKQKECLEYLNRLPDRVRRSGWAQLITAKLYCEAVDYKKAHKAFDNVRRLQPFRIKDMDLYSTVLWQLREQHELDALVQELQEIHPHMPETWLALGNSLSLQREHESALKCFQRAIDLNPDHAYAHNLAGHEYFSNEAFETAQVHFRSAVRLNPRLYNAWYGLGMIYFKQEKWDLAEFQFRQALQVNRYSPILQCQLGIVFQKTNRLEEALLVFDRAIQLNPLNPLMHYRRATCLVSLKRYAEALREFREVIHLAPKESHVYMKIGQLHKVMNDNASALEYYALAMNTSSKSAVMLKEAIENLYTSDSQ